MGIISDFFVSGGAGFRILACKVRVGLNKLAAHMQLKGDVPFAFAAGRKNISLFQQRKVGEPMTLMCNHVHAGAWSALSDRVRGADR